MIMKPGVRVNSRPASLTVSLKPAFLDASSSTNSTFSGFAPHVRTYPARYPFSSFVRAIAGRSVRVPERFTVTVDPAA